MQIPPSLPFSRLFCRMIVMLSYSDCHFQERRGIRAETWRPVERPEPAEVVVEVAARHALEAAHPITQPRAEGIDVLDGPSPVAPDWRMKLAVLPERSRAISTARNSSLEVPRLLALPPRCRALRNRPRCPLAD